MMQLCNEFKDAIVALVVKRWSDRKPDGLGRTMLQKLVYFIQAKAYPFRSNTDCITTAPFPSHYRKASSG